MHKKIKDLLDKDFAILKGLDEEPLKIFLDTLINKIFGAQAPYRDAIVKMYEDHAALNWPQEAEKAICHILLLSFGKHPLIEKCYKEEGFKDVDSTDYSLALSCEVEDSIIYEFPKFLSSDEDGHAVMIGSDQLSKFQNLNLFNTD